MISVWIMKNRYKAPLLVTIALFLNAGMQPRATLRIGDAAPMVNEAVQDVSGRSLTLSGVAGSNGLLVIFSSNTCPWVSRWEGRYNALSTLAGNNNIGIIALNPNEAIRDRGESMEDMRSRTRKLNYDFPYAMDEGHKLADAFGVTKTPEVFLFDGNLRLVYHGAIDDNPGSSQGVRNAYVVNAINALVNGTEIGTKQTSIKGCSVKRGR